MTAHRPADLSTLDATALDRFWSKVLLGNWDACWPWSASLLTAGYGSFWFGDRNVGAHRVAYAIVHGHPDEGLSVCHRCDNPPCVNPAHLFVGTRADNQADKVAKQRQARGARHGRSKLKPRDVVAIRERLTHGETQVAIAKAFGVSRTLICDIGRGKLWSHLP